MSAAGGIATIKPRRRHLGVADCVLNVSVPEVSLQRPRVVSLVRERKATGVPQHVRMGLEAKLGLDARTLHHPGKASRSERRAALRREYEG